MMEEILVELGMEELVKVFAENEVGPSEFLNLTDDDYLRLGVSSIGRKAKIRNRCKLYLEAVSEDSPTIQRLRQLQAARRRRIPSARYGGSGKAKSTRRLSVGWRHMEKGSSSHIQVTFTKGGGTHRVDYDKTTTLQELTRGVVSLFFPGGESKIQKLNVSSLDYYLATFTGANIPTSLDNGDPFSVEGYFQQMAVQPVRIYLYTSTKSQEEGTTDMNVEMDPLTSPDVLQSIDFKTPDALPDLGPAVLSAIPDNLDVQTNNNPIDLTDSTDQPATVRSRLSLRRHQRRPSPAAQGNADSTAGSLSTVVPASSVAEPEGVSAAVPSHNASSQTRTEMSTDAPHGNTNAPAGAERSGTVDTIGLEEGISVGNTTASVNQRQRDSSSAALSSDEDDNFLQAGSPDVFFRVPHDDDTPLLKSLTEGTQSAELLQAFTSLKNLLGDEIKVEVHRNNILEDTMQIYSDRQIVTQSLNVTFVGESGEDLGGLSKDYLTTAWREIIKAYFDGEDAVIPALPLHKHRKEKERFVLIGRFITHSVAVLGILPPRLSRTTILGIAFEDDPVSDDILMEDFMLYLTTQERTLLKTAMKHFDILSKKQKGELLDFFSLHNLQALPTADNIEQQVLSIAQNILVDRPAPLVKKIRQGIPAVHVSQFWSLLTTNGVNCVFKRQRPTGIKVSSVLSTENDVLRPDEERAVYYLKQYLNNLDQDDLSSFLQFVTGSTLMPANITVSFRHVTGESRCPVAHTCANVLELPSTYTSLQDLKREFRAVLACQHSFEMTIL